MTRASFTIPEDLWRWLAGYAASRGVSRSRALCDVLVEKRTALARQAREDAGVQNIARRFRA
jgi:hypothetical protein